MMNFVKIIQLPGTRDNNTGYVYTKPKAETKITHRDKVFVLATNAGLKSYFNEDIINKNEIDEDMEDKKRRDSMIINEDNLNDNLENEEYLYEEKKKYSPFNYIREQLYEIDKEIISCLIPEDILSFKVDFVLSTTSDNLLISFSISCNFSFI